METWVIALVVVLVLVAVYYFAVYRPKHKTAKSGYQGTGYGWHPSDYDPQAPAYPVWFAGATRGGNMAGCSANSQEQACHMECAYKPQGMSHQACHGACMRGDLTSSDNLTCRCSRK